MLMLQPAAICTAQTYLTPAEQAWLARTPERAYDVTDGPYDCDLEEGHEGDHATQVQASTSPLEWWLLWGAGRREIIQPKSCGVEAENPDDPDWPVCWLPENHPGAHRYTPDR